MDTEKYQRGDRHRKNIGEKFAFGGEFGQSSDWMEEEVKAI